MNLFKKLFGFQESESSKDTESKFMPEKQLPTDERFAVNFNNNGGKFIYCENEKEVQKAFASIISENNNNDFKILYPNEFLSNRFHKFVPYYTTSFNEADAYVTECENLIADKGAILFTSRQIGQKKIKELPKMLIVCATTSQLVNNLSDALRAITHKHRNEKPNNISALEHFNDEAAEDDFRNYGSCSKNTYLLLLEDLEN